MVIFSSVTIDKNVAINIMLIFITITVSMMIMIIMMHKTISNALAITPYNYKYQPVFFKECVALFLLLYGPCDSSLIFV